jgi:putative endonuclease
MTNLLETQTLRRMFYVGVTATLVGRVGEHRDATIKGFTHRYNVHHLVWYERWNDVGMAIAREKAIKRWRRAWKIALIEEMNPDWRDLWDGLVEG